MGTEKNQPGSTTCFQHCNLTFGALLYVQTAPMASSRRGAASSAASRDAAVAVAHSWVPMHDSHRPPGRDAIGIGVAASPCSSSSGAGREGSSQGRGTEHYRTCRREGSGAEKDCRSLSTANVPRRPASYTQYGPRALHLNSPGCNGLLISIWRRAISFFGAARTSRCHGDFSVWAPRPAFIVPPGLGDKMPNRSLTASWRHRTRSISFGRPRNSPFTTECFSGSMTKSGLIEAELSAEESKRIIIGPWRMNGTLPAICMSLWRREDR
jgi:hypothetical protein